MPQDQHPNPLPNDLARALRGAIDGTLTALTALRVAVRSHVHKERADGNDLDDIQVDLRDIVTRALHGLPARNGDGADHGTVTREIMQWSEAFYAEKSNGAEPD